MPKPVIEIPNIVSADKKTPSDKLPNILVIDDDQVLLELFGKVFRRLGLQVMLVNNGKDALELTKKHVPDVILLDIKMPGMDGMAVLKEIKKADPDVEIIIMTGYANLDSALEAIKYGAFDYLKKPFEKLEQVVNTVWRAWERRKPNAGCKNIQASLERRIYELKLLYNTCRFLGHCTDKREMAVLLLESLSKIVEYDLAVLILEEKPQQMFLFLQVVHPIASQLVEEAKTNLLSAYNSISQRKLLYSEDFDQVVGEGNIKQEKAGETASSQTLNSFLNIPLMDGDKMIGMVNISSMLDRPFSSDDIGLIYSMVNQALSTIQKLNSIKTAERDRLERLTRKISEGVIMVDENFEVVTVNPAAQTILSEEKPDLQYIQNCLGLDLHKLKIQMETTQEDMIIKKVKIQARAYLAAASLIKGKTECFEGLVISINPSLSGTVD